jgi:hypothetical protein
LIFIFDFLKAADLDNAEDDLVVNIGKEIILDNNDFPDYID